MKRLLLILAPVAAIAAEDFAMYVNPFVGCAYNGHTFPGAAYPFGNAQPSPDTGYGDWQHCSGYVYEDPFILGFSQTHLSGTGVPDLGDVLLLPFTGAPVEYKSGYDKSTEIAEPGYYAVTLTNFAVRAEMTATPRVSLHRYTFAGTEAKVLADFQFGLVGGTPERVFTHVLNSHSAIENNYTITGSNEVQSWVRRQFHYVVEFNKPFTAQVLPKRDVREKAARYVLTFDIKPGESVEAKVAISGVDIDGAKKNLAAEAAGWDFAGARKQARNAWNTLFSRTQAEGDLAQKQNFYTSLYHLFIQPNNIADVDGRYRGADGNVATAKDGAYYSTLSCWDTFRAAHPLYTILTPERVDGFVNTALAQFKAVGYVPVWALAGKDNYCMIGNHSIPYIVDAWAKGFRGFDAEEAFAAIEGSLRNTHSGKPKENWDLYDKYGYYPFDLIKGESVSRTLECGYDDWCAGWFAEKLGKKDAAEFFLKRSQGYKLVFDPSIQLVRGKDTQSKWREPFDPFMLGHGAGTANDFTEGNSWQYTWHVMQDPEGLVGLFGSKEAFGDKLDSLFKQPEKTEGTGFVSDVTGLIGQYAHGNEPSHHTVYFFQYADRGWRTQELVREVFDKFYLNKVDGLCGNDDCGQMSAWYVFSAMGFYPFNPSANSGYVLGAPQLPKITVNLANGKTFTVVAKNLSKENKYVKALQLNGKPLEGFKLSHEQITNGGELVFEMASTH